MSEYWNEYLNEMRHDAIAKQTSQWEKSDIELLGRMLYLVTRFARLTRKYGLLAMEEEATTLDKEKESEALLYDAVELVVDGCHPEVILESLSNRYWVNQLKGYEATAEYIAIRGMLLVQKGEHALTMERILSQMLPSAIRDACIEICRDFETCEQRKYCEAAVQFFEKDFTRAKEPEVRAAVEALEQKLLSMSDASIQRLLRETEHNYVVQALVGMRREAREALTRNMSTRLRELVMEDCYGISDIEVTGIAEGANHLLVTLKLLRACGEIPKEDEN